MNPQLISHATFGSEGKIIYFSFNGSGLRREEPAFSQLQRIHVTLSSSRVCEGKFVEETLLPKPYRV